MSEDIVARYRPSPRTAALPMAFTGREFFGGALAAWGYFLALIAPATVAYLVMIIVLDVGGVPEYLMQFPTVLAIYAIAIIAAYIVIVPWSIAGFLVGASMAYAIGLSLRRTSNFALHVAAFTILGLIVGIATSTLGAILFTGAVALTSPTSLVAIAIYSLVTAVAVPLGWLFAASRALRSDADGRAG